MLDCDDDEDDELGGIGKDEDVEEADGGGVTGERRRGLTVRDLFPNFSISVAARKMMFTCIRPQRNLTFANNHSTGCRWQNLPVKRPLRCITSRLYRTKKLLVTENSARYCLTDEIWL